MFLILQYYYQSIPDVFSAGLDISVLSSNCATEFDRMWEALQNLWLRVYCSPLAIIAAINVSI